MSDPQKDSGQGSAPAGGREPISPLVRFADQVQGERSATEPAPPEQVRKLVAFWVCGAEYALPIEVAREVLRVDTISRVPQAPPHIRGVTNVRGRVIPVVELSTCLGGDPVELTPHTCLVVVAYEGRTLGLLVDSASGVMALPESAIEAPPEDVLGTSASYISGVGTYQDRVIILVDLERVLATGEPSDGS